MILKKWVPVFGSDHGQEKPVRADQLCRRTSLMVMMHSAAMMAAAART